MTKINVDTSKLVECGKSIISAGDSFNADIKSLYSRMYNVPRVTKEWIGVASNQYASIVLNEKGQYIAYGNTLKKMGNILNDYAVDIENAVKETKI